MKGIYTAMELKGKKSRGNAIILLSGGQDSVTCLYWAKNNFEQIIAVSFDFGQKNIKELEYAKKICELNGIEHRIIDLKIIQSLKNAENFVSGRNIFLLAFGALLAKQRKIKNLVVGVSQQDFSDFPDCRDVFIKSLNVTLNLGMDYTFHIHTPLMNLNKREIWEMADDLGIVHIIINNTLTCYNGISGKGCGTCSACRLRDKGYKEYIQRRKEFRYE